MFVQEEAEEENEGVRWYASIIPEKQIILRFPGEAAPTKLDFGTLRSDLVSDEKSSLAGMAEGAMMKGN